MISDERASAELATDLDAVLRLLRKHRPVDGFCLSCGVPSPPACRPLRLARAAAYQIGNADG